MSEVDLGACPTGEHAADYRHCGFMGCVDLKAWAKGHRYRWRYEESYKAESNQHIKGDGRWYVEVQCRRGMIYPKGGRELLAFTVSTDVWKQLLALGATVHQGGFPERVCKFPVELLDYVAAVLRPRKLKTLSPEHLRAFQEGKKRTLGDA